MANEEQKGNEHAEQATDVCGVFRGRGRRPQRRWGQCQRGGRVVRPRRADDQSGRSRRGDQEPGRSDAEGRQTGEAERRRRGRGVEEGRPTMGQSQG